MQVDQRQVDEWVAKCRAALEPKLDEPVTNVALFGQTGFVAQKAAGRGGLLTYLLAGLARKKLAGGLPQQFVLVATPTKLRAFATAGKRSTDVDPDQELAVWDRAGLRVASARRGMFTKVTLDSADGDHVDIQAVSYEHTDAFIRQLQENGAAGP
jgi:hypothetical protein